MKDSVARGGATSGWLMEDKSRPRGEKKKQRRKKKKERQLVGGGGEFPLGESCRRQWRTFLERGSSRGREQQISDENGVHRETLKGDERKKKKEKKEEGAERTRVLLASPFFLEEFVSFVSVVLGWRIIH